MGEGLKRRRDAELDEHEALALQGSELREIENCDIFQMSICQ